MTRLRRARDAVLSAAALPLAVATPAAAHPLPHVDEVVVQGSGTITPGLGPLPEPQSIAFDGTATVIGTDGVLTTWSCSFSGESPGSSTTHGLGSVSGACGPIGLLCAYVRIGAIVAVECVGTATHVGAAAGSCLFVPHTLLPTTSYSLVCGFRIALV